jgi:hypothetical protein
MGLPGEIDNSICVCRCPANSSFHDVRIEFYAASGHKLAGKFGVIWGWLRAFAGICGFVGTRQFGADILQSRREIHARDCDFILKAAAAAQCASD